MTKDIIEAHLEQGLKKLKEIQHLPYIEAGIPFHEALVFLCTCEAIKPTLIIDSGVSGGRSLDIWATAYPNTKIIAIDKATTQTNSRQGRRMQPTIERIKKYSNVELRQGKDSIIEIPFILQNINEDDRVVICIDGPKYTQAIQLATRLIKISQVKAISIHDMDSIAGKSCNMGKSFQDVFYTDEPAWQERFAGKFENLSEVEHYSWWPKGTGMSVHIK